MCCVQAVIERQNIRDEESEAGEEEAEIFYLQLAQCVVILTSLLAVYVLIYSRYILIVIVLYGNIFHRYN